MNGDILKGLFNHNRKKTISFLRQDLNSGITSEIR